MISSKFDGVGVAGKNCGSKIMLYQHVGIKNNGRSALTTCVWSMTSRRKLKLQHMQAKEGLVDRLTKVIRDTAGELLTRALEDSPTSASVSEEQSRLRNSYSYSSPGG